MTVLRLFVFLTIFVCAAVLDAAAQCSAESAPKMQSAATSYSLTGLSNPTSFSIADRGAATYETRGSGTDVTVGYARLQASAGSTTPAGYLVFSYRKNGVLVSEASVPESRPISTGRIYATVDGPVNTGVAIVNPNSEAATISFYLTDASGRNFGNGSFTLAANSQIARFLNEFPFNALGTINGTMTFSSTLPVGVIALQGNTNERHEFLMTTLPVADLNVSASSDVLFFPHYAVGGGWNTKVVLVNTGDAAISGTVEFLGAGTSVARYLIAPRSMQSIAPANGTSIRSGAIRVTPDPGMTSPSGLSIFSFKNAGVTVTEAGVPILRPAQSFRMYEIDCGSYPGQIQTGVAIANPSLTDNATVRLELTTLSGESTGMTSTVTLPPSGQIAAFMKQFPGFESLPFPFHGVVRISTNSPAGVAVIGLRGEYNDRNDFLVTTSMPVNEATPPSSAEALFSHMADGGGYKTEFILFTGTPGQSSSGTLQFFTQSGEPLN